MSGAFSTSLGLSICLPGSLRLYLSVSVSTWLSPSLPLCACLPISIFCLCVSGPVRRSASRLVCLCLALSACVSACLFTCLSVLVCISVNLSMSTCLYTCLSVFVCVCVNLSVRFRCTIGVLVCDRQAGNQTAVTDFYFHVAEPNNILFSLFFSCSF